MKFLKAIDTDGETVFFSVDKILTITPKKNGSASILMGAGLYWHSNAWQVNKHDNSRHNRHRFSVSTARYR